MEQTKGRLALLRRREVFWPTWRGWLVLLLLLFGLFLFGMREIHPFLAVTSPVNGGILVIEGWCSDYALETAVREFREGHYERVYVTGGPLEAGAPLAEYKTYAQRGAAILTRLGVGTNEVQAVPAPLVRQDRTYTSAVALRDWLQGHNLSTDKVYLLTEATHARRSRLMYCKAFGKGVKIGIRAIEPRDYDPRHWWRSSMGVRSVIDETFAYVYARLLFWPKTSEVR